MTDAATPQPPRRPRFQIHLSTMIVLTMSVGALLLANLRHHGWPMRIVFEVHGDSPMFWWVEIFFILLFLIVDALTALIIVFPIWYIIDWIISRIQPSKKRT